MQMEHVGRRRLLADGRIYLRYIGVAALVVGCAVSYQLLVVHEQFRPEALLAPLAVTLFVGIMLGRNVLLKRHLERKSEQFRAVADLAEEFTFYQRLDGGFDYVSPACRTITGYRPAELISEPALLERLVYPEDRALWKEHQQQLRDTGMPHHLDLRLLHRNGAIVWVSHTAVPVYDARGHRVIGLRATTLDISQRKHYEEHIEHQANYDLLTGLPNRRLLMQRMGAMIAVAGETAAPFAVLFLDLDRFKYLNDSYGHAFGDQLLKTLGERLTANVGDCCVVSRFGGDEFVILLPAVATIEDATRKARNLLEIVEIPLEIAGSEFSLSGSIGIALYPSDGTDADTLIRNADAAMYRSKRGINGKVQRYSPAIVADAASFLTLENQLRKGLRSGEFVSYYQPKICLDSSAIIGFEALARWRRSDGTISSPDLFIPVAEETGMIRELGEQMLELVCHQLYQWREHGLALPVAVNVSGHQFAEDNFVHTIAQLLNDYQLAPQLLELEITEQALIGDMEEAIERLAALRALGIRIALDDFGTGFSSLNYLRKLPIDQVKIDRSFIRGAEQNANDMAILRTIISLCGDLHLEIVVEGIETAAHHQMLRQLGCRVGQGYYFHRPMPSHELSALLVA